MILNRARLRVLVESVLLEGFKDDQRYLVEKYPDRARDLSSLQPKWIAWLTARFGESPRIEETHPLEDTIVTVLNFSRKDAAIGEKYRSNEQFRTAIDSQFPPDTRSLLSRRGRNRGSRSVKTKTSRATGSVRSARGISGCPRHARRAARLQAMILSP